MTNLKEILFRPRYSCVTVAIALTVVGVFTWYTMDRYTRWYFRQLQRTFFQSPLPHVVVASPSLVPDSIAYKQKYDFTVNWFTGRIPVWEKLLEPFKGKPDVHYLEIGLHEGRSAIWMLENILTHPTAKLTGIDIFDGPYKDRYFANIEKSGSGAKVTTITGFSQVALRKLPLDAYDIIYIDGSHSKEDVLEDAVLSWRLLKEDGLMIFDDYQWIGSPSKEMTFRSADRPMESPKPAIDKFVQCFENHLIVVHNSYQLVIKKKR